VSRSKRNQQAAAETKSVHYPPELLQYVQLFLYLSPSFDGRKPGVDIRRIYLLQQIQLVATGEWVSFRRISIP
jgi:hypothetical protein